MWTWPAGTGGRGVVSTQCRLALVAGDIKGVRRGAGAASSRLQGTCSAASTALEMKTLLPTLVLLGLVAALQAQDPLSLQPEEPNLIGTWYTKALVSNMTLPGPKTFQVVFPSTMTAREDGSLQARVTLMIMGQCHEKEILMQKTEEPGKYSSSGGAKLIYVEELSTKDHYILYCEKRGPKKMFGVGKLIGRTPEESPEALEEFRKFVQRKGLPQEKITIPEQRESCVPERD